MGEGQNGAEAKVYPDSRKNFSRKEAQEAQNFAPFAHFDGK